MSVPSEAIITDPLLWVLGWAVVGLVLIVIYAAMSAITDALIRRRETASTMPDRWIAVPQPYPGCLTCEAIGDTRPLAARLARHQEEDHSGSVRW